MSRLEEIKAEINRLSVIEDVSYAMLPEDVEKLKVIKLESVKWLINRVEELEDEIYQDPRQGMLEDLHMENERYKRELENLLSHANKQMERYGDRYGQDYDFERYDEVSMFAALIEQALEQSHAR